MSSSQSSAPGSAAEGGSSTSPNRSNVGTALESGSSSVQSSSNGVSTPSSDDGGNKPSHTLDKKDLPTPVLSLLGSLDRVRNILKSNKRDGTDEEATPLLGKSSGDIERGAGTGPLTDPGSGADKPPDESVWSTIATFLVKGPNPPRPKNAGKEPWRWYHAWTNVTENCREIFVRERESELNVLDGVR
jgi:hypothetical protein